jgi:PAS domain S-box-containing protein
VIASLTLERILDLVPAKIAVLTSRLQYAYVNEPLASALGVTREGLVGKALGGRNHANFENLQAALNEAQLGNRFPMETRFDFIDAKGNKIPHQFYFSKIPMKHDHGFLVLSVDVSRQFELESQIQKELTKVRSLEQYLQTLYNAMPDPVFVRSSSGEWLDSNDSFLQLTQMSRKALAEETSYHYLSGTAASAVSKMEFQAIAENVELETEETLLRGTGEETYFLTKRTPVTLPDGKKVIVGVMRDITEKKQRERELDQLNKMHFFSHRLESLNDMAHRLGHEINNPLAIIKLKASALAERLKRGQPVDPSLIVNTLTDVEEASERIAQLILAMRSISKPADDAKAKEVLLVETIQKTLPFCVQRFEKQGVQFRFSCPESMQLLRVKMNVGGFSQALMHVLNNAYDALQGRTGGEIELRVEHDEQWAIVSVKDNGTGISPENVPKVFDPFFSTKQPGKGTGLGLSLSRQTLVASGGNVDFTTGTWGTEFVIRLPLAVMELKKTA